MKRIALLALLGLTPLAQTADQLVLMPDNFAAGPQSADAYIQQQLATGSQEPRGWTPLQNPYLEDHKTLNIYKFSDGDIQFQENYGDGEGGVEVHDYSAY